MEVENKTMCSKLFTISIISIIILRCIFSFAQTKITKENKVLEGWKIDTCGCLGYRTPEEVDFIRDSLYLINKSKDYVLEKLGMPNCIKKYDTEEKEELRYNFNTICRDGIFIDSLDYCWLEIFIVLNKVKYVGAVCY